ncbi:MAG: hypothetical protein SFV51_24130 [Bryobacteraceae bacterium]|nr:hypothetical protein [Bryobacteraceae bacterium]
MSSPAEALQLVLAALDRLEIHYMIGGSVASSVHGVGRPTMDVDLVVELSEPRLLDLLEAIRGSFYADAETGLEALRRGRAFNVIHLGSAYKFDIFPLRSGTYDASAFARRSFRQSRMFGEQPIEFSVASAEDTMLAKLRWYQEGGGHSQRQLEDVAGILQVQGGALDWSYLRKWAKELGLEELLARFDPNR